MNGFRQPRAGGAAWLECVGACAIEIAIADTSLAGCTCGASRNASHAPRSRSRRDGEPGAERAAENSELESTAGSHCRGSCPDSEPEAESHCSLAATPPHQSSLILNAASYAAELVLLPIAKKTTSAVGSTLPDSVLSLSEESPTKVRSF